MNTRDIVACQSEAELVGRPTQKEALCWRPALPDLSFERAVRRGNGRSKLNTWGPTSGIDHDLKG